MEYILLNITFYTKKEKIDNNPTFYLKKVLKFKIMEFYNQQRLVLILSRQLNMSNKDIAYEMGLSIKGVEAPITKALKHLSKELKYAGMLLMILLDKM